MSRSKRVGKERSAELRALLGCTPEVRTVDAVRGLIAERDKLRQELADMGKGLAAAWQRIAATDEGEASSNAN